MSTHTGPERRPGLDAFESRLLTELRREVAHPTVTGRTRGRARRRIAVVAGAAAAAVAGVLVLPGLGTSPAYSVSEGNSREITVEVHRPEDAAGLERALADHGIDADVTYLPGRRTCAADRYRPVDRRVPITVGIGRRDVQVTLSPGAVRDGETFVMVWSVDPLSPEDLDALDSGDGVQAVDGFASSVTADVTDGPVLPCRVVPAG